MKIPGYKFGGYAPFLREYERLVKGRAGTDLLSRPLSGFLKPGKYPALRVEHVKAKEDHVLVTLSDGVNKLDTRFWPLDKDGSLNWKVYEFLLAAGVDDVDGFLDALDVVGLKLFEDVLTGREVAAELEYEKRGFRILNVNGAFKITNAEGEDLHPDFFNTSQEAEIFALIKLRIKKSFVVVARFFPR